ncbi:MAG: radical SAM protein [Desulfobacteraceae bacterium]|nr:radical SAM protein [Desulfobacteraceae bacterium]
MNKPKNKEHDFSSKLRQSSVIGGLKKYIAWQRNAETPDNHHSVPNMAPISINLDLTTACNFSCPHCVDSEITNTGESLDIEEIKQSLDTLKSRGLLSVILLGGGEPTLYNEFAEIVRYIKNKGLQLGIVTNGSKLGRVSKIADLLGKNDWVRLSLDAASQETFNKLHRPRTPVALKDILHNAQELKMRNPDISLGYSFVIMWEGLSFNGNALEPNIHEMSEAVRLASKHLFDYISFKPCLIRLPDSKTETLLDSVDQKKEQRIIEAVKKNLQDAKDMAGSNLKVLESVNLIAMMNNQVHELKKQPHICHMQIFNTVVAPSGIFHCPAFRGVENAKLAESNGYAGQKKFDETLQRLTHSITAFNAAKECDRIACFYNHVNWWVENFIHSDSRVEDIEEVKDDNFFI